jgi:GMP synthase-like glutamine amidotransferase
MFKTAIASVVALTMVAGASAPAAARPYWGGGYGHYNRGGGNALGNILLGGVLVGGAVPSESILIVDFGSQVTQLIARRVREAGVYSEIAPFNSGRGRVRSDAAQGRHPVGFARLRCRRRQPARAAGFFDSGLPILGICYGQQVMSHAARRHGRARPRRAASSAAPSSTVTERCVLFDGLWRSANGIQVWMSHGDKVTRFPRLPPSRSATAPPSR